MGETKLARMLYFSICSSKKSPFEPRSEEHTSELQSQSNLVCRLLLEKKKGNVHLSPCPESHRFGLPEPGQPRLHVPRRAEPRQRRPGHHETDCRLPSLRTNSPSGSI